MEINHLKLIMMIKKMMIKKMMMMMMMMMMINKKKKKVKHLENVKNPDLQEQIIMTHKNNLLHVSIQIKMRWGNVGLVNHQKKDKELIQV